MVLVVALSAHPHHDFFEMRKLSTSMAKKTRSSTKPVAKKEVSSSAKGKGKKPAKDAKVAAPKSAKLAKSQPSKDFGYVSKKQAAKALSELQKYVERVSGTATDGKSDLFADEDSDESKNLFVEVVAKKYFTSKAEFKPRLIELTKPFYRESEALKTCLFLRDHFITSEEQLQQVENADIPTLAKILTLSELKTVYQTFEKRRELYKEYDLFVVDDALLSSMPQVLGKTFYMNQANKFPVNVRVASTKAPKELSLVTLSNQVNKVLSSTAYLPPAGTTVTVQIGNLSSPEQDLLANLNDVLKSFEADLLVTVGVRTTQSPVLPLFYTDRIYDDSDVLENAPEKKVEEDKEDAFAKALLELGDEESVAKALGGELRKIKRTKKSKGVSKP